MRLTPAQTLLTILAITLGVMLTRFLPFLIFPEHKKVPGFVSYLGKILPAAMMGFLVVYGLKGISLGKTPFGIPEAIAMAAVVGLYSWKNNVLLSIGGGTAAYMLLMQVVFC